MNNKIKNILSWVARLVVAGIILQTLFFKFTAHPDSVAIFSTLGVEPWGRILLGVIELIVGISLLIPKTHYKAAFASTGIMIGAIASHLFVLGINFNNDGGALFIMAVVSLLGSISIIAIRREK